MSAEVELDPASPGAPVASPGTESSTKQPPAKGAVRRRGPLMLLFAASIVVMMVSLAKIAESDALLAGATFAPSIVALIWLACYLATTYLAFGTPYLFASAYIVCLFVFHFGLLIQDGLGLVRLLSWLGPLGPWAVRAGWYTNLALACIAIGFSGYALKYRVRKVQIGRAHV